MLPMLTEDQEHRIEHLKTDLKLKGVHYPDNLAVFNLGSNEQIIGELPDEATLAPNHPTEVYNPKRLLRLQQVINGGLSISFYVGDMDLVSAGECMIAAPVVYRLSWLSAESQIAILSLYMEYMDRRILNRAQDAGLITPDTAIVRGK